MPGKQLDGQWLDERLREVGSNRSKLSLALTDGKDRSVPTKLVQGKRQLQLREVDVVAAHLRCSRAEVFRWAGLPGQPTGHEGFGEMKQPAFNQDHTPLKPDASKGKGAKARHPAIGALKGMITLLPDVDYTEPADPDWGKVYED